LPHAQFSTVEMMIPIRFVPAKAEYNERRPAVTFDTHAVALGGTVDVRAASDGGWVWDINCTDVGECGSGVFEVSGGSCTYVSGFSGDESNVHFKLTHEGISHEIVVVYNTRPD
jgi:hypothetical protein